MNDCWVIDIYSNNYHNWVFMSLDSTPSISSSPQRFPVKQNLRKATGLNSNDRESAYKDVLCLITPQKKKRNNNNKVRRFVDCVGGGLGHKWRITNGKKRRSITFTAYKKLKNKATQTKTESSWRNKIKTLRSNEITSYLHISYTQNNGIKELLLLLFVECSFLKLHELDW